MAKKSARKKHNPKKDYYNPGPTPKKILGTLAAFVSGNVIFAFTATIPTSKTINYFAVQPAIISTSIILATASYFIISMVKE